MMVLDSIMCVLSGEVAGELVANKDESGRHKQRVCRIRMLHKGLRFTPISHENKDRGKRKNLPDLYPDVERY